MTTPDPRLSVIAYVRTDRHGRSDVVVVDADRDALCRRQVELIRHGYKPIEAREGHHA